jgi:hypothetical protein
MFFHLRVAAIALCFAGIAFLSLPPTAAIAQVDDLTPVPQDTRFRDRPFSQEAFWYIPWWDDACQYYNLPLYCSYRRLHQFENAVLTMEADSTAYARASLDLKNPGFRHPSLRIRSDSQSRSDAPQSRQRNNARSHFIR